MFAAPNFYMVLEYVKILVDALFGFSLSMNALLIFVKREEWFVLAWLSVYLQYL